jgi:hypothetical protein
MSDSMVSRSGADTESLVAHAIRRKGGIDPSTSPRELMDDARIAEAPAPPEVDRPASIPQITPEIVQENLRRIKASAENTLIRVLPDGKREYYEDRVIRDTDGVQDTATFGQRSDRGEGTVDSLKLSHEDKVRADRLLPPRVPRDAKGHFVAGGK